MRISILIPFHKGNETLPRVFDALARLTVLPSDQLEVMIAVDGNDELPNPSAWSSLSWPVHLFQQEQRGQSMATNLAARQSTGDWLWLLAQDMLPHPGALVELLRTAGRCPNSLIQGHIDHHPDLLNDSFTRYVALESNFQFSFHAFEDPENLKAGQHYSPHALVERLRFLTIGGYDEQFPYGFQDADFGLRWKLNGDRIVYARDSIALHEHTYDFKSYARRQFQIGRAAVDFFVKWGRQDYLALYSGTLIDFETRQQPHLAACRRLVEEWLETGVAGALPPEATRPNPKDSDLQNALFLLLGWEYLKGIRERLEEQGLTGITPPDTVRNADGSLPHPFSWVDTLTSDRARPRH
ncbi:MAG: glycosyltransferase [bacterium]